REYVVACTRGKPGFLVQARVVNRERGLTRQVFTQRQVIYRPPARRCTREQRKASQYMVAGNERNAEHSARCQGIVEYIMLLHSIPEQSAAVLGRIALGYQPAFGKRHLGNGSG